MHSHNRQNGFTIIEVLFVLAIAGVIMLIIFQAIPVLSRNSRNSQRKSDVASVLQSVSRYELNNSGTFPDPADTSFLQNQNTKTTIYDLPEVHLHADTAGNPSTAGPNSSTETIDIYNYQKCSSTNDGSSTSNAAGFYDTVALFAIESGGGVTSLCQQL